MAEKRLVVIIGNGLSQACSGDFASSVLSAKLRAELAKDDALGEKGLEIADGLASYLDGPSVDGKPGFEQLVGAFDSLRRSVGLLGELKSLASPLADAVGPGELEDVGAFCDRVYRRGTAVALQLIDDAAGIARKDATGVRGADIVDELVRSLRNEFGDAVTYATLNYDTLLMQALTEAKKAGQMSGFGDLSTRTVVHQFAGGTATELRADWGDGDRRPTRLVNLHGSVQYWSMVKESATLRVKIDATPAQRWAVLNRFAGVADEPLRRLQRPLVIFGNQRDKSVLVNEHPFSVAYERLKQDLRSATGVLVIGYGFGDEVLNSAIRECIDSDSPVRAVLVATSGGTPADTVVVPVFKDCVAAAPKVFRGGIGGLADSDEWAEFTAAFKAKD